MNEKVEEKEPCMEPEFDAALPSQIKVKIDFLGWEMLCNVLFNNKK